MSPEFGRRAVGAPAEEVAEPERGLEAGTRGNLLQGGRRAEDAVEEFTAGDRRKRQDDDDASGPLAGFAGVRITGIIANRFVFSQITFTQNDNVCLV